MLCLRQAYARPYASLTPAFRDPPSFPRTTAAPQRPPKSLPLARSPPNKLLTPRAYAGLRQLTPAYAKSAYAKAYAKLTPAYARDNQAKHVNLHLNVLEGFFFEYVIYIYIYSDTKLTDKCKFRDGINQ